MCYIIVIREDPIFFHTFILETLFVLKGSSLAPFTNLCILPLVCQFRNNKETRAT